MKVTLVGMERINYKKKDGTEVDGIQLHITKEPLPTKQAVTIGKLTEGIYISSRAQALFAKVRDFKPPCDIDLQYEIDGRYPVLVDITKISH